MINDSFEKLPDSGNIFNETKNDSELNFMNETF